MEYYLCCFIMAISDLKRKSIFNTNLFVRLFFLFVSLRMFIMLQLFMFSIYKHVDNWNEHCSKKSMTTSLERTKDREREWETQREREIKHKNKIDPIQNWFENNNFAIEIATLHIQYVYRTAYIFKWNSIQIDTKIAQIISINKQNPISCLPSVCWV